jgi:hypothetical protein
VDGEKVAQLFGKWMRALPIRRGVGRVAHFDVFSSDEVPRGRGLRATHWVRSITRLG